MTHFVLMGKDMDARSLPVWHYDWLFDADAHASCTDECMRQLVFVVREERVEVVPGVKETRLELESA